MQLKSESGEILDKVSTFDKGEEFQSGRSVEGEVTKNGNFLNFRKAPTPGVMGERPAWIKGGGIAQAQARKEEMIYKAQDRKEESIAYFNAINASIALVKGVWPMETEEDLETYRKNIVYWRDWFYDQWSNFKPEDHSQPF